MSRTAASGGGSVAWSPSCALVTGATSGIGEAAAVTLAEAGIPRIVVTGRDAGRAETVCARLRDLGVEADAVLADLSDAAVAESVFSVIDGRGLLADVLVNAGGTTKRASVLDCDAPTFDVLFAVNVRAPMLLCGRFVERLRRAGSRGTVVNVLSLAMYGGAPSIGVYAMTKAALALHTRNAAHALRNDGVRVNGLDTGWTLTPGEDDVMCHSHHYGAGWEREFRDVLPLGRLMRPAEVAGAIRYLATDASAPTTGSILDFDQAPFGIADWPPD